MKIMPNRLDRGFYMYQKEFEDKALEVLRSGWYVLGNEVKSFEEEWAAYTGAKYCVGLASGLDALWMAFRILGIGAGDEVIVQGNTYIASVMGITMNGATPIFVEPDEYYNIDASKIEEKITERTKAILVVHLYGQASQMDKIVALTKKYNLPPGGGLCPVPRRLLAGTDDGNLRRYRLLFFLSVQESGRIRRWRRHCHQ